MVFGLRRTILIISALKLAKSENIITNLKRHVTTQSLISIYYALVFPCLNYGCILWVIITRLYDYNW